MEYTIAWNQHGLRNEVELWEEAQDFFDWVCGLAVDPEEEIDWVYLVEMENGTVIRQFNKVEGGWVLLDESQEEIASYGEV